MDPLTALATSLDGELLTPGTPGYDTARRPANPAFRDAHPRAVVRCRSVRDVARAISFAAATGERIAPRGGGHCFAGRSSTEGLVLDLSALDDVRVDAGGLATIGAGARLGPVYAALHTHGRTLPAGCGPTVGIAGLTLGGGIGLLGRAHGLTCDNLVGAQAVLHDGAVVECDDARHPDLFWALRGAGGGQFAVVTSLRFRTVPEPITVRIQARWTAGSVASLVRAWQAWAPDTPDGITVNLTLDTAAGEPVAATLFGASTYDERRTRELLSELTHLAGATPTIDLRDGLPFHRLKTTFTDLDARETPERPVRIRSELFSRPMSEPTVGTLLDLLDRPGGEHPRHLAFTAMGGAYARVAEDATAFAHRDSRFLLEHVGDPGDAWTDDSWRVAHAEGSGRVYPNFPDPALAEPLAAYHGGNLPRLTAVKAAYDARCVFDFPQAVPPGPPAP